MASLRKLTVLISGSGTNLQAVIDATKSGVIPAKIIRVLSNRKGVKGLERAENAGIPTIYHNLVKYKKKHESTEEGLKAARNEYDADLAKLVLEDGPDLVVCAGFMHVFGDSFLSPLAEANVAAINLHPALPGQYNGTQAIERAHQDWLDSKITKTGVMIHYVIQEVDMGTPVVVRDIPFVKGEDEDLGKFEEKLHKVEWEAIVEGTNKALQAIKGP